MPHTGMTMKHMPEKRQATLDGQRLAYSTVGEGMPIVLINGAGGPLEGWFRLYPRIGQMGRVLAYDRAGVGGSAGPMRPQSGRVVVETLRRLIAEAGLQGPCLLVAYSFGGLHANLFARLHPAEVAGVLFLEAAAPEDIGALDALGTPAARVLSRLTGWLTRRAPEDEVSNERETLAQIAAAPGFPPIPLRVLSGARRPPAWMMSAEAVALRERNQLGLSALSPNGQRLLAVRSGHFPQMSEPERVLQVLQQLIEEIGSR